MKILVTGTAGFIGFHLANKLLERGDQVFGLDNLNDYYDVDLKLKRLNQAGISQQDIPYNTSIKSLKYDGYSFIKCDLQDRDNLFNLFSNHKFDAVCNLAAQAGVRYSLVNPYAYQESNIQGFLNILECCRNHEIENLSFASSSSVYGLNETYPFNTSSNTDHPISLYAASKKSNELMAHAYSHLYGLKTTGLRFFTVYGPWGRPDMALFIFTKAAYEGLEVEIYNQGDMYRDFTYIDDITEGVVKVIDNPAQENTNWDPQNPDPSTSSAPFKIYNIGNNNPVKLIDFVETIEAQVGKKIKKKLMPIQAGDVTKTYADVNDLVQDLEYQPNTDVETGIKMFVEWYKQYYKVN